MYVQALEASYERRAAEVFEETLAATDRAAQDAADQQQAAAQQAAQRAVDVTNQVLDIPFEHMFCTYTSCLRHFTSILCVFPRMLHTVTLLDSPSTCTGLRQFAECVGAAGQRVVR